MLIKGYSDIINLLAGIRRFDPIHGVSYLSCGRLRYACPRLPKRSIDKRTPLTLRYYIRKVVNPKSGPVFNKSFEGQYRWSCAGSQIIGIGQPILQEPAARRMFSRLLQANAPDACHARER